MAKQKSALNKPAAAPRFRTESEEAEWWASEAGREYTTQQSRAVRQSGTPMKGSKLVGALQSRKTIQIALRLPEGDMERAKDLANRKGVGYQTLIKMLIHEGLDREASRY